MSLAEAAAMLQGRLSGADARFHGVSTDTRSLQREDLFVALRGERFNGHDFMENAAGAGAASPQLRSHVAVVTVASAPTTSSEASRTSTRT